MNIADLLGCYEVDIPGNGIAQAGIDLIQGKLTEWGFGYIPAVIPLPKGSETLWMWDWKVSGIGEYVGTLPKRISKLIWQVKGIKLTPEQLSEIGNIGSAHSGRHQHVYFDVVDTIDWIDGDFDDEGSCFWTCRCEAKKMIEKNGGGAIRFFTTKDYQDGLARAFIVPWEDCWIVFNGYGTTTLSIAHVLAAYLGHSYYRQVELRNNRVADGTLWINGQTCYLVGSQESVLKYERIDLKWKDLGCRCDMCEDHIDSDDHYHNPDDADICDDCYNNNYFRCSNCEDVFSQDEESADPNGESYCSQCWSESFFTCSKCDDELGIEDGFDFDEALYCESCHDTLNKEEEEEEEEEREECISTSISRPLY